MWMVFYEFLPTQDVEEITRDQNSWIAGKIANWFIHEHTIASFL